MKPFAPLTDDPAEYWLWLAYVCDYLQQALPPGTPPRVIGSDHRDDRWKEDAQAREKELENAPDVREFLERYLTATKPFRLPKSAVLYCTQLRLKFGQLQATLFATKCSATERCPLAIPDNNKDTILWLLDDVYLYHRFGFSGS